MTLGRRSFLFVSLAYSLAACTAQTTRTPDQTALSDELQALLTEYDLPGMTAAMAGPRGVTTLAAGLANRESGKPMTLGSTLLAASIHNTPQTLDAKLRKQLAQECRSRADQFYFGCGAS